MLRVLRTIAVAVLVVLVGGVLASAYWPRHVVVENEHGVRLTIPRNYVHNWGSLVRAFVPEGVGDSQGVSVPVALTEAEVFAAIPAMPRRHSTYVFLIHLLPPWQNIELQLASRAQRILDNEDRYTNPQWHPMATPGWVRVQEGTHDSMYDVLRYDPSKPIASNAEGEWIASCTRTSCLTQFSFDRFAVDVYLSEQQLPFRDDLRRLIESKVKEWK